MSVGLPCFSAVKEADGNHLVFVTRWWGGPESVSKKEFTWVNTMLGNVKNAITGIYHSINSKHALRYLAARKPYMLGKLLKLAEAYG